MTAPASSDPHLTWTTLAPAIQRAVFRFTLVGISPVVAFYIAFRLSGPIEAIIAGTVTATAALLLQALRMKRLDPVGVVPIAAVLIQGAAGLAFQSVDVYLAAPAVENTIWGMVLLGSVAVGKPFVVAAALELKLLPERIQGAAAVRRALRSLTILWGLMFFVKAAIRLALLSTLPLEQFLVANTLTITFINILLVLFTLWYPVRAARRSTTPAASSPAAS